MVNSREEFACQTREADPTLSSATLSSATLSDDGHLRGRSELSAPKEQTDASIFDPACGSEMLLGQKAKLSTAEFGTAEKERGEARRNSPLVDHVLASSPHQRP
jgi:hypothetical protein